MNHKIVLSILGLLIPIPLTSLLIKSCLGAVDFIDPPSGSVVANFEGSLNATTLTCNVSHEGSQRFTFWSIANFRGVAGKQSLGTLRDQNLPLHLILEMDSFFNQVIVTNWTTELDGVVIFCGIGSQPAQANVTLRLYRSLNLKDNLSLKIQEGDLSVPVDLLLGPMPFPLPSKFEWLKDGRPLRQSDLITTTYSSVTFASVMRTDAGNYTVNATNFLLDSVTQPVGSDTGSFYLDVLYAPSFVSQGPAKQFVRLGDNASLVCGTGLESNPQATITWTAPDGTTIVDNINARYDEENGPNFVRLNFTNTTKSDSGVWRCEAVVMSKRHIFSGGQFILQNRSLIGSIITQDIQLTVIAPPGQPHTLLVKESEATLFQICWEAPVQSDSHISYYILRTCILNSSAENSKTIFNTITNATSSYVTDLLPGTTYELTVVAVSQGGDVVARSQPSDPTVDTTAVAVPELSCNASIWANGTVTVSWSFVHTGGLPLTNVSVSYTKFNDNNLSHIPIPLISVDTTSVTIPDLKAGFEYTFNVTAVNSEGSSSTVCGLTIPESVPLDKRSNIVAIVGGVFGGLVVLGIVLLFSIAVALIFSKQGNQRKLEAVYEEPNNLQRYIPQTETDIKLELQECPAYVERRKDDNIELEECPAYGHIY